MRIVKRSYRKIQINNNVLYIGAFSRVDYRNKIIFNTNTLLANNVFVYDYNYYFGDLHKLITGRGFISGPNTASGVYVGLSAKLKKAIIAMKG